MFKPTGFAFLSEGEKRLSRKENKMLKDRFAALGYDDYSFSDEGGSGSGDALSSILGAIPSLTNAGIAAFSTSQGQTTFAPTSLPSPVYNNTSALAPRPSSSTWLVVAVLFVIGLFAYREL